MVLFKSGTSIDDLAPELAEQVRATDSIVRSYLAVLGFIAKDSSRDPTHRERHLLTYLVQDLLQSAISIVTLAREGMLTVAKRELRFVVESSIKLCFVQQTSHHSSISERLKQFEKALKSQKISIGRNLTLGMLTEQSREAFIEEVGRIYSLTSNYVHLSPFQIQERIDATEAGRTVGRESPMDVETLNSLTSRGLACSLVLLFHSVPDYVAGDWFVERDGSTVDSYFMGSRFMASMDSHFDYKSERQERLAEVRAEREAKISF